MGHFTTIKGIKVDCRIDFLFHPNRKKIGVETFFCAMAKFLDTWGRYLKVWRSEIEDPIDPVVRFRAEIEDVPALSFDKGCTDFIRNADNWVADPSAFDGWYFNANLDLGSELECFFWEEIARYCGIEQPEKVGYDDTGYECECSGVYVSDMRGYVPTEDAPISDYKDEDDTL